MIVVTTGKIHEWYSVFVLAAAAAAAVLAVLPASADHRARGCATIVAGAHVPRAPRQAARRRSTSRRRPRLRAAGAAHESMRVDDAAVRAASGTVDPAQRNRLIRLVNHGGRPGSGCRFARTSPVPRASEERMKLAISKAFLLAIPGPPHGGSRGGAAVACSALLGCGMGGRVEGGRGKPRTPRSRRSCAPAERTPALASSVKDGHWAEPEERARGHPPGDESGHERARAGRRDGGGDRSGDRSRARRRAHPSAFPAGPSSRTSRAARSSSRRAWRSTRD